MRREEGDGAGGMGNRLDRCDRSYRTWTFDIGHRTWTTRADLGCDGSLFSHEEGGRVFGPLDVEQRVTQRVLLLVEHHPP